MMYYNHMLRYKIPDPPASQLTLDEQLQVLEIEEPEEEENETVGVNQGS